MAQEAEEHSVIHRSPKFCPKCNSPEIAPTGEEKILTSPSGMPWQEGWSWKCAACGHEWVPPDYRGPHELGGTPA